MLGPVCALVGENTLVPGGPGLRGMLAMLLLEPNQVVSVERVMDVLWDHEPPATARTIVQGYVSRLRRWMSTVDPTRETRIQTSGPGYRLVVDEARIDVALARELLAASRGRPAAERAELLARAQGLWRGPELSGIGGRVRAPELAELRLTVLEARIDADLELGRHDEVIGELAALVDTHPFREHLVGQLALALYRSGRRAAALEIYQRFAHRAARELGLDPGPGLRELHSRILRDDTALLQSRPPAVVAPRVGVLTPAQLPAAPSGFTGREPDLGWLDDVRLGADGTAPAIGVLVGPAGVGKSALAVVWGTRAAGEFPDGRLYAALRGFDPDHEPVEPAEVLARFLLALGVAAEHIPEDLTERVTFYRSLLADRRLLVVLDDARDSDQVRPLLPGAPGAMVLVTSRRRLDGLVTDGAALRVLDTLPPEEAEAVIAHAAGPPAADERDLRARLAKLCGHLPLALRIAGARLVVSPQWSLQELVDELADEHTRLSALRVQDVDTGVRAALDLTYGGLDAAQAEALRLLGAVPGPTVGPHLLATMVARCPHDSAVAGEDDRVAAARDWLRALAALFLVTETDLDVFGMHDLVRLYARELGPDVDLLPVVLRYYLVAADIARRHLRAVADDLDYADGHQDVPRPRIAGREEALAWFEREWPNLIAAAEAGAKAGLHTEVWQLARMAGDFRRVRSRRDDWEHVLRLGLESARSAGDRRGEVLMRLSRCVLLTRFDQEDETVADAERAVAIATELRDSKLMAMGFNTVAGALYGQKRYGEALAGYRKALELSGRAGYRLGEANLLNNIAQVHRNLGSPSEAVGPQAQAVAIFREVGDHGFVGHALANLAELEHELDLAEAAELHAREAIATAEAHGLDLTEAFAREVLARVLRDRGDVGAARVELTLALELYRLVQSPAADAVQAGLAALSKDV
ncbi:BTAD domain-containing putative transcriptional regulator [Actinokineospora auranticolor]|uniref:DNA-binding SARP family transcriptional activator n=1 Tax=Actinokineospora auranticolor TaxID=155976 RepID=A0A2S6GZK8_9PSEU|nr:BTAD domain-containing putative transcriptional regulator [Actinokineospora auranticolor]PPK70606.1 DNA-binding SARP family transcriptional activator [Actinokineospora auranticolor]